ncbi:SDR family NAD(P)-dependent oxidoreductase [Prescottella defluvii]|uniref:SDR family NAD(P)-dependent oxidoreductase n=1 Tax=Prescottella defluvii TaxID=1323361 RepID=UPI0004F2DFF1|nr:SDR family NAD(P)-dependent oxidoreductase [Prescottella defluvii]
MIDLHHYGPWAVIAGGSEGVGAAFAEQLSRAGLNLVLIARKPEPLEATAESARRNGVEVRTLALDLLAPDALDRVRETTHDIEVGLLVVNAGAGAYASKFVDADLEKVRQTIDLNIAVPLALTQLFGADMKARGRGGILLLGSISGYLGTPDITFYAAAKAFSRVFAEGLWLELAPYGVHVLELVPGATRTPALGRLGLNLDALPGLADPADVAREGLEHLADGPLWITSDHFETAKAHSAFPRDGLLLGTIEKSKKLMGSA